MKFRIVEMAVKVTNVAKFQEWIKGAPGGIELVQVQVTPGEHEDAPAAYEIPDSAFEE